MSLEGDQDNIQITLQVDRYCGERPSDNFLSRYRRFPIVIGRADTCDFILMDVSKYISSKHALIYTEKGDLFIHDTSANGVYINGSIYPIGRGNTEPLKDGDTLSMGDFRLLVQIGEDTAPKEQIVDSMLQLTSTTSEPTKPLSTTEVLTSKVRISETDHVSTETVHITEQESEADSPERAPIPLDSDSASKTPDTTGTIEAQSAVKSLLHGAGINPDEFHGIDDDIVLQRTGALLFQAIRQLILQQSVIPNSDQNDSNKNTIANQDLESISVDNYERDVGEKMLSAVLRKWNEVQDKQNSSQSIYASNDTKFKNASMQVADKVVATIQAQQLTLADGIDKAFDRTVSQFNPAQIEKKLQESESIVGDNKQSRDAKLWQLFIKQFPELEKHARTQFHQHVSAELGNPREKSDKENSNKGKPNLLQTD